MAKRKSTDKISQTDGEDQVEADAASESKVVSDTPPPQSESDMETAAEAVDAVDTYAPAEESVAEGTSDDAAPEKRDEAVELKEPTDDAPIEGPDAPDASDPAEISDADKTQDEHISEDEAEKLIVDAETVEGQQADPEPIRQPDHVPLAPQVIRETTVERKGGFFPMLLGGAVAAALGYGGAAYVSQDLWPFQAADDTAFEDEIRAALTTQDGSLSTLGERIATLESAEAPIVDLGPLEDQLASVQENTAGLTTRLDELASRIDTLERQPLEQAVSPEAIAAYERALADLQAEVEAQRNEVAQMAQEAVTAEANAEEQAQLAASRAALAEITSALESGDGFSDAIAILSSNGVAVPDVLVANAESGVATLGSLIESFPDAARSALSAARSVETEASQGAGRVATFFANQLGARSVAPREGDDADAILSRAEAAVRSGDLDAALSELSGLPDVAKSALSEWQSRAQTRLEAKTAADGLVQQLIQE